jgi:uncharacterized damage-inducible protein DinB/predicted RNase H-like HicB family nuclease
MAGGGRGRSSAIAAPRPYWPGGGTNGGPRKYFIAWMEEQKIISEKGDEEVAAYTLYLESGPMRKKTMIHVFDLLGCIVQGATTEAALEDAPRAIRSYLEFLRRHGEDAHPDEEIQTRIAEHNTNGEWIGSGHFSADLEPLVPEELERYVRRLEWSRAEVLELVSGLSEVQMAEKPLSGGRPVKAILEHIFGAEYSYTRHFGKLDGIRGSGTNVSRSKEALLTWMGVLRESEIKKLRSLSRKELSEPFVLSKSTHTARRLVRRMLEHEWEHLVELKKRLL